MRIYKIALLSTLFLSFLASSLFALPTPTKKATDKEAISVEETTNKTAIKANKKAIKKLEKQEKRKAKLKKKLVKLEKKMEKMGMNAEEFLDGIADAPKFRLGVVLLLGAIAISILMWLLPGSNGLLGWLGGLVGFVGVVLIIWALIENA